MAEGCNLFLSEKDYREIVESRLSHEQVGEVAESVRTTLEGSAEEMARKMIYPLAEPHHPAHKVFSAYVLRNVAGNESIPDRYKQELPRAVAAIARITPDALGLARPATNWGPGAQAVDQPGKLGHKTRGAAFAYEVLGTAALITGESKAANRPATLRIHSTDRLDLGIKLQASYPGTANELPSQPRRCTVEADLFISRPASPLEGGGKNIGVDFKHALDSGTYSGMISDSQIAGIRVALQTGEIQEFHFVTNGKFSSSVRQAIEQANHELSAAGVTDRLILYHENVHYGNS